MEKKSYIVAVDVGSSEVVVAVGSYAEDGVINIECVVAEPTEGVTAGLVDNNQMVASALIRARQAAEQQVGIAITDAYVSISGKFVRCARYTDHVFVEDVENCIALRDVEALRERMENVKAADVEVIMDLFPINYKGDTGAEMKNPVGSYSKQLSSTYNFILCERSAKDRFRRVFLDAGIKIRGMYASAAVVAESVINSDEMQEGVAVVDIGSGVTDIAEYVWKEISEAGFAKKLSAGIVLTGGVADLKNVADLFARVTGQETRVACAEIGVSTESLEKVS